MGHRQPAISYIAWPGKRYTSRTEERTPPMPIPVLGLSCKVSRLGRNTRESRSAHHVRSSVYKNDKGRNVVIKANPRG